MPKFQFCPIVGVTYVFDGSESAYENHELNGKRLSCRHVNAVEEMLIDAEFEVEDTKKTVRLTSDEIFWCIRIRKKSKT